MAKIRYSSFAKRAEYTNLYVGLFVRVSVVVKVHGVVVAVPSDLHFEVASACLQAGAHVLVEKPLSLFLSDARELHRLAIESGRCLMVGHLLRFHPGVVKMLQLIRCKRIGNVQHIHCSRLSLGKWRRNENVLWSFAPHDISLCAAIVQAATNSTQAKLPLPDTISCSIHGTKTVVCMISELYLSACMSIESLHQI